MAYPVPCGNGRGRRYTSVQPPCGRVSKRVECDGLRRCGVCQLGRTSDVAYSMPRWLALEYLSSLDILSLIKIHWSNSAEKISQMSRQTWEKGKNPDGIEI